MVNVMRLHVLPLLLVFSLSLLIPFSINAQPEMNSYLHIDYLSIDKNEFEDFHNFVQNDLMHQVESNIDSEKISGWYLYRVTYPGTQNSTYNYVILSIGNSISSFEPEESDYFSTALNDEYKLSPSHSELWRVRNSVKSVDATVPSRYMVMNYMSVGLGYEYEYQMLEDEIALPLHRQRMERDMMDGWALNELLMPGGTEYGYNFSTLDFFKSLVHTEFGFTDELIRQTHPDTNINEFFNNIYRTRDLVRSEVWELVHAIE